jgi:nitroimidazol reductase NimA-like FMN-containing flavoprotein (pyridoxamine 5'-phosphate oxidase superfamily)
MPRTQIKIHPERSAPSQAAEFLAAGMVAHVAFEQDGEPYVIPMIYQFDAADPDHLYLHGAPVSRLIQHLGSGMRVCVTVTMLDALIYSRSATYHSVNYRSVVCFGKARPVTDDSVKKRVLEKMIARYFPGRTAGVDYFATTEQELRATAMISVDLEETTAKTRTGPPKGPFDKDDAALGSAGVMELGDNRRHG